MGLLLLALAAGVVQAQEQPRPTALVTDAGGFLSSNEVRILSSKLEGYADTTSSQVAIVTQNDLGGTDIATYATELGEAWGVGQAGKDNGVVIVVAREEREVFIAVGYGLEGALPDAVVSRIVRNTITPLFRDGRFFQGLSLAVDEIMLRASGEFTADEVVVPEARTRRGVDVCGLVFFIFLLVMVLTTIRRRGGGGPRRGNDAIIPLMFMLGHASGRGVGGGGFGGGGMGGFGGGGGFGGFGGGGFGGGGAGGGW